MLLHPATAKAIQDFVSQPAHALLISGPEGSGKGSVAQKIAADLLNIDAGALDSHPYTLWLRSDTSVSIENIRAAQKLMQLKVPGSETIRRVVIVEQAQTMSIEAQNAFLKLLEEPPADTVIILTASATQQLLPTILSRLQQVTVLPPSKEAALELFGKNHKAVDIEKAFYLSEGYVGLLHAILEEDTAHPLVEQIQLAKAVLAGNAYTRLCQVDAIAKEKQVPLFLKALERICHAALVQAAQKGGSATNAWKNRLQAVVAAEDAQKRNPSAKLLLTDLFLAL